MTVAGLAIHASCIALATILFLTVNWIGRHAVSFGYSSTTLFEDPEESFALNFIIRTLPPAVFMVLLSAGAVASGNEELRLQSYWIPIYYYGIRAAYFPVFGLQRLINWPRFIIHSGLGILSATAAYNYLILPKKSLLPDLETAGNELWLALLVFVYAVGNNIVINDSASWGRRNSYVRQSYNSARNHFGNTIDGNVSDDLLKLIIYATIVFENYCRPPIVRAVERAWPAKKGRTTGIMQVTSTAPLSDQQSVSLGVQILSKSWEKHVHKDRWDRIRSVIADYNKDDDYVYKVMEVMDIIANRVEPSLLPALEDTSAGLVERGEGLHAQRLRRIRTARFSAARSPRRVSLRIRRK